MAHSKLSRILDLELAWKRVKKDQYDDIIPDILYLRDVDSDKNTTIRKLKQRLDTGYRPSQPLEIIDIPKKGYTLRPGSYLIPEDRIIYQAVVDYISLQVEEPPEDCVFSYRLNKEKQKSDMFQFWRDWWLRWRKEMRKVYADGYCSILRTDIAAYFEHIDHRILRERILNGQVGEKEVLDLLDKLLKKWALSDNKHIGIPQGFNASSFIGNLYLIDLDKKMRRNDFKYFRYSDEIYVLTKSEHKARKAIQFMTHELRNLHLNLQDAKTDILEDSGKIEKEIGTDEEDKIKVFDYEFIIKQKKGTIKESEEEIIQYWETMKKVRAKEIDVHKFKWCIHRLSSIKNRKAVNFILKNLSSLPFLSDEFSRYLQLFINKESVKSKIIEFLNSRHNIYEWQEMWLLLAITKAKKLDSTQLDVLRKIVKDMQKNWAPRCAAIFALGKLGDRTDRNSLIDLYDKEGNNCVQRAIAVSVHDLPKSKRNIFYNRIKGASYNMERLVNYLKQQNEIKTI